VNTEDMPDDPEFVTLDGLKIRTLSSLKPDAETVMLLSPWPESIYAFARLWPRLAAEFSLVAVDLPGFGRSEGRPDLMSAGTMGDFVVRLAAHLGLDRPHAIGPDVGTGALLFAAATHPEAFRTIVVGAGASTYPLHVEGLLKTFIDAESVDPFRSNDPGQGIRFAAASIQNYDIPDTVVEDYVQSYSGDRFIESIAYVRNYPTDLAVLAPLLATLATPVQIIVGRQDPYGLAEDAELLDDQLPHSRLDVLDCGHCAWEEEADAYGELVVDWIRGASANV
jgi:pimeloyl-ACP methyl ester carboxylesterase